MGPRQLDAGNAAGSALHEALIQKDEHPGAGGGEVFRGQAKESASDCRTGESRTRHSLSAAFGDMSPEEFDALVTDIKQHGLIQPIVVAKDDSILDGWHRYKACLAAGIKPRFEPFSYVIEPAAENVGNRAMTEAEFVLAQNVHRRHLTPEQKRNVVAELLKANPQSSNRAIAEQVKVDHKTVGTVRGALVAGGEIPQLATATGKDGKVYAAKKAVTPKATAESPSTPDVRPPDAGAVAAAKESQAPAPASADQSPKKQKVDPRAVGAAEPKLKAAAAAISEIMSLKRRDRPITPAKLNRLRSKLQAVLAELERMAQGVAT